MVESPDGGYVCLYTAFDGKASYLFVATSDDLVRWQKTARRLPARTYARRWSKSGAIVTEMTDGRLKAAKVDDQYLMYWGEGTASPPPRPTWFTGHRWSSMPGRPLPLLQRPGSGRVHGTCTIVPGTKALRPLLFPRPGRFDSLLVEPGPPAVRTDDGIVLIYNGAEVAS